MVRPHMAKLCKTHRNAALRGMPAGCYKAAMFKALEQKLRHVGLRPTRQRLSLARLLFAHGDRHVSAEQLHAEAQVARVSVSLATVYNTLNQFKSAGLLREIAIEGERSYFDTNTSNHFHFFDSTHEELMDFEAEGVQVTGMPSLPKGKAIDRIDVIVRLKDKS
jgi:Fur family iron response transcriptional regulator